MPEIMKGGLAQVILVAQPASPVGIFWTQMT
jgi:hypothetical protein